MIFGGNDLVIEGGDIIYKFVHSERDTSETSMNSRQRTSAIRVRRASNNLKKLSRIATSAAKTTRQRGELARAAGRVVAKRSTLGAAALLHPSNADHAEFSRLVPEKAAAFSASGMALYRWAAEVAVQMARTTSDEVASVTRASTELALCRSPTAVVAVQTRFAVGWFERALSQSLAASALAMRSQGAMLAPLHRAATANARRLEL
jgi:hypothetical protein